jgi:hypothetical protein
MLIRATPSQDMKLQLPVPKGAKVLIEVGAWKFVALPTPMTLDELQQGVS